MHHTKTLAKCLAFAALLFAFSIAAAAGDTCGGESCTATNTCDSPCTVQLSHSGSALVVKIMINGSLQAVSNYFCVGSGVSMTWQTPDDFFFAKFASSPFTSAQSTISGSTVNVTSTSSVGATCYSFGAASCAVSASATSGGCGEHDPRVVVTGSGPK